MAEHASPGRPWTPSESDKRAAQALCNRVWAESQTQSELERRANDVEYAMKHGSRLPNRVVLTRPEAFYASSIVGVRLKPTATLADAVLKLAFRGTNWRVK